MRSEKTTFRRLFSLFCRSDMVGVSLALAHCREEEVNTVVSGRDARTPLHLAAALGHLAIAQILIWVRNRIEIETIETTQHIQRVP
jgi:hypothetical protein